MTDACLYDLCHIILGAENEDCAGADDAMRAVGNKFEGMFDDLVEGDTPRLLEKMRGIVARWREYESNQD